MDLRGLSKKLQVDKNSLDTELEEQPNLYFQAATEAARAKERRELCKIDLSLLVDEVIAGLRADDAKIAENRAAREAEADPEVIEKRKELARCTREESEWAALAAGALQKSHVLTALGSLYSNSYYVRDSAVSRRRRTANEV